MIGDNTLDMLVKALHKRKRILWIKRFIKRSRFRRIGEEHTHKLSFLK